MLTPAAATPVLFDVITRWEWWPFAIFVAGFLASGTRFVYEVWREHSQHPQLGVCPAAGKECADSHQWNDVASLRGVEHRLLGLHISVATRARGMVRGAGGDLGGRHRPTRVVGVKAQYMMDGVISNAPRHLGGFAHGQEWDIEEHRLFLRADQSIAMFGACCATPSLLKRPVLIHRLTAQLCVCF